ncbi:hypothetical protein [Nitrospirillum viridazoti]|uniref:hypothetical protein n=1 Tax=Nitrospirillum viridazoti TaxID=3144925 RepID=UPI000A87857F|nr:hypothetical protein [Nitrospirillum amazonense]
MPRLGREIIITRNGKPVVRLSALPMAPVGYGDLAGLRIGDDVSLSDDVLDDFLAR